MKHSMLVITGAILFSVGGAAAQVPDCYEVRERIYNDGTTNKSGAMYDTNFWRGWVYGKVQEMDDAERRIARNYPGIASLIGPCILPDGRVFHMVDGVRPGRQ